MAICVCLSNQWRPTASRSGTGQFWAMQAKPCSACSGVGVDKMTPSGRSAANTSAKSLKQAMPCRRCKLLSVRSQVHDGGKLHALNLPDSICVPLSDKPEARYRQTNWLTHPNTSTLRRMPKSNSSGLSREHAEWKHHGWAGARMRRSSAPS